MKILEEQICQIALRSPDKIAVIAGNLNVSYKELWRHVLKSAFYFKQILKLEQGSRVLLSADKNIEFIYSYLGAHLAGMVCVPVDPKLMTCVWKGYYPLLYRIIVLEISGILRKTLPFPTLEVIEAHDPIEFPFPSLEAIADLLYTTGTTGMPKGSSFVFFVIYRQRPII